MRLDDYLARSPSPTDAQRDDALVVPAAKPGRRHGWSRLHPRQNRHDDRLVRSRRRPGGGRVRWPALARHTGPSGLSAAATEFRFDHVTAKPLSRETWLTYATTYRDDSRRPSLDSGHGHAGSVLSGGRAHRQQPFGDGVRAGAGALPRAGRGTGVDGDRAAPAHRARDAGDGARRPERAGAGQQAGGAGRPRAIVQRHGGRLKTSFDDLVGEVETRKSRERELEESEARLRASEDRLQLAIDAAGLGIWDWDVEQDRLVWDDSMYRLYGVRKEEFSGAFDAWSRCLVPEDLRARHRRRRGRAPRRPRVQVRLQGAARATAPSAPFAAWGRPSATRTAGPCAWSASTGTSRI